MGKHQTQEDPLEETIIIEKSNIGNIDKGSSGIKIQKPIKEYNPDKHCGVWDPRFR